MKKRLIFISTIALSLLPIIPAVDSFATSALTKSCDKVETVETINQSPEVTYDILQTRQYGRQCGYDRNHWDYLYWNEDNYWISDGSSFEQVRWCEDQQLLIRTDGENNNDRFIYQQIGVNFTIPANVQDFKVTFQGSVYEWWHRNWHINGSEYRSSVQMFDLGDDVNSHPEKFNNIPQNDKNYDSCSFLQHSQEDSGRLSNENAIRYNSESIDWTFNNDTDQPKKFTKYIGISFWIGGQYADNKGDVHADIKVSFCNSASKPKSFSNILCDWGDIKVSCDLNGEDTSCKLVKYVEGTGTLVIPDHITYINQNYYIREIPSNWSDGENDITGLKFADDVRHLKVINDSAFEDTNCLDYYIDNKTELLEFPEGLERIGKKAFYGTDYGTDKIKGYSFPWTLEEIDQSAFEEAPYIDGDNDNGQLIFRSAPKIKTRAFHSWENVDFTVCGKSYEMSRRVINQLIDNEAVWLVKNITKFTEPHIIDENSNQIVNKVVEKTWKDIKVKCTLYEDECRLMSYVGGKGTICIPDYIEEDGKKYYVKEIPSKWSVGENNITGIEFADDVSHLKIIKHSAFEGTNCLDEYLNKDNLLKFPEGLEEIESSAFAATDFTAWNKIKGYSFPSTLKKIGCYAFGNCAPYIDGDKGDNGELHFKSIPEIDNLAFVMNTISKNNCKYIYASTQEMADKIAQKIKNKMTIAFNVEPDYLIPKVIENDKPA